MTLPAKKLFFVFAFVTLFLFTFFLPQKVQAVGCTVVNYPSNPPKTINACSYNSATGRTTVCFSEWDYCAETNLYNLNAWDNGGGTQANPVCTSGIRIDTNHCTSCIGSQYNSCTGPACPGTSMPAETVPSSGYCEVFSGNCSASFCGSCQGGGYVRVDRFATGSVCSWGCQSCCGDGKCILTPPSSENCSTCPQDCGACPVTNTPTPKPTSTPTPKPTNTPTPVSTATPTPIPTYTVSGSVWQDDSLPVPGDGIINGGEPMIANRTVDLTGSVSILTTSVNPTNYSFSNVTGGFHTITLHLPPNYVVVSGATCSPIPGPGGNCAVLINVAGNTTVRFGIAPIPTNTPTPKPTNTPTPTMKPTNTPTPTTAGPTIPPPPPSFSVAGNVFIDKDTDGFMNGSDYAFPGAVKITIRGVSNPGFPTQTLNFPTGVFNSGIILYDGTYIVSTSVPSGFQTTYPKLASYQISVGTGSPTSCIVNINGHNSGCSGGSVTNLNFGITNLNAWFHTVGGDYRNDQGNAGTSIPDTATDICGGPNASYADNITNLDPGIIISQGKPSFSPGQISSTNWNVGSPADKFTPVNGVIRTSYSYMMSTITQNGLSSSVTDLNSVLSGCSTGCNISGLSRGLYRSDSSVVIDGGTITSGNIVILINGDLRITNDIKVEPESTLTISALGNIFVDAGMGETDPNSLNTNIEGFYSAGHDFVIEGNNSNCSAPADRRINFAGAIVVNANLTEGRFLTNRDICAGDSSCPTYSFTLRPDLILNAPKFIKRQNYIWQEVAP